MILILICLLVWFGIVLFMWGPDLLNSVMVCVDEWRVVLHRIHERRDKND